MVIVIIIVVSLITSITFTGSGVVGESYSVVCSVDLDDNSYNIVINATLIKIREGVVNSSISSGHMNISISYTSLMTSQSGQYQCLINVSQIDISYQVFYIKTFTINTSSKL